MVTEKGSERPYQFARRETRWLNTLAGRGLPRTHRMGLLRSVSGSLNSRRNRLIGYYVVTILGFVAVYTVAFHEGSAAFEPDSRELNLIQSLEFVVQTFTTTGYGQYAGWESWQMNVLVIAMQATGVFLIFTALPIVALPLIQDALATRPPSRVDPMEDHVVVCAYDVHAEVLIDELDANGVEYLVVESDREQAVTLYQEGYDVIHGDPESMEVLEERAHVDAARAVVVEASDEVGASIILSARAVAPEVRIVSVTEDGALAQYHRYAGADRVLSPRELVGDRLARKATTTVTSELDEAVEIGEFEIAELAIHSGSQLVGKYLDESRIRERTGANVIGAWVDGEFRTTAAMDEPLDEHTVLLVVGREEQCEALNDLTLSAARRHARGTAVVAGLGEAGTAVVETLDREGIEHRVLDREDREGVDVVGDATDPETLERAGVPEARTLILTLGDDAQTIFATLVARNLAPDLEIIARANDRESVRKIYRAGADYVLALSRVTGRLLAANVLDEDLLAFDTQVKVVRTSADHLAGQTLVGANVRQRTGTTVIAVERDDEVITGPEPSFELREGDQVIVAGTDSGIAEFREL